MGDKILDLNPNSSHIEEKEILTELHGSYLVILI